MPHRSAMNGIIAHTYAALAVAAVLTFPTPEDLVDAIWSPEVEIAKSVEADMFEAVYEGAEGNPWRSAAQLEDALEVCIINYSDRIVRPGPDCSRVIEAAQRLSDSHVNAPGSDYFDEKLELAITLKCRARWSEATAEGDAFSMADCVEGYTKLADAS